MRLVLVDASAFLWRYFHANEIEFNESGIPINALDYFARYVLKKIYTQGWATHACVVFDGFGKNFRHDLHDGYKAHRPPMPEELREQIVIAPLLCEAYGIPFVVSDGFEADDVLATLATLSQKYSQPFKTVIASPDKDILQLVRPHISIYNHRSKRHFQTDADVKDYTGVLPSQIVDWLALCGDTADGFLGIKGVGPKTAASWLGIGGNLKTLIEHPGLIANDRLRKLFIRGQEDVLMCQKLAQLECSVPGVPEMDEIVLDHSADPSSLIKRLGLSYSANLA